jgi:hypothetical protein
MTVRILGGAQTDFAQRWPTSTQGWPTSSPP